MAITLNSWGPRIQADPVADGFKATLFADTKAEIVAEDATVATANEGAVKCLAGSACITALGEVCLMNSSGVWAEI